MWPCLSCSLVEQLWYTIWETLLKSNHTSNIIKWLHSHNSEDWNVFLCTMQTGFRMIYRNQSVHLSIHPIYESLCPSVHPTYIGITVHLSIHPNAASSPYCLCLWMDLIQLGKKGNVLHTKFKCLGHRVRVITKWQPKERGGYKSWLHCQF